MTKMTVRSCGLLTLIVIAATAMSARAQQAADRPVVKSEFQKIEATIEAIDPRTREVSLRGPDGPVSVVIGPEVHNFASMHVGDKVVVSYYQGIAAQLAKGDRKATDPAAAATFGYRAHAGQRPGGGVGASITTTVTIEAIDSETNTVAFRRRDGSVHIIAVKSPDMVQLLHTLKPGDLVEVTYTESVAVNVLPAAG